MHADLKGRTGKKPVVKDHRKTVQKDKIGLDRHRRFVDHGDIACRQGLATGDVGDFRAI